MSEDLYIKAFLAVVAFMWVGVALACWAERRSTYDHDPHKEPWGDV